MKFLLRILWCTIFCLLPLMNAADAQTSLAQALMVQEQPIAQKVTQPPTSTQVSSKTNTDPYNIDEELAKLTSEMIEVLPTQFKLPKNAKLKMKLPLFGEVSFTPLLNEKGDVLGFQAQVPQGKPFELGQLKIEKGLFKIIEGKLSYTARVTLFGKSATLGLQDFSLVQKEAQSPESVKKEFIEGIEKAKTVEVYRLTLGLAFDKDAFAVELIPGKKIEWKTFTLVIEQDKGISLHHEADIFGQRADLALDFDSKTKEFSIKGEIKKSPLIQMIPELKGSILDGLFLEGMLSYTIKQGLILQGSLKDAKDDRVEVAGIVLNEAKIDINMLKKHALVSGKTTILGLPLLGYFAVFFGTERAGAKFAVEIPAIENWQPFKDSTTPELRDIMVYSLKAGIRAQYVALSKGDEVKAPEVFLKNKSSEDIFASLEKNADNVVLHGAKGASLSCFIAGKSTILNMVSEVILKLEKAVDKPFAVTLVASLPDGWKLSQSFPSLKSGGTQGPWDTALDAIALFKIDNARAIASTRADNVEGYKIEPGFNILADVTLDGTYDNVFLKMLAKSGIIKIGDQGVAFKMQGAVNPSDPKNLSLTIGLSAGGFGFNVANMRFQGGQFNMIVRGKPSMSLAGLFSMIPSPKEDPLTFYLDFFVTPIAFGMSASMKNVWKSPFGIKGFEFGNLGGEGTQTWTVVQEAAATEGIAALVPATLALTGQAKLGAGSCDTPDASGLPLCTNVAVNLGKDVSNLALVAESTNPVNLFTLARLIVKQMGGDSVLLKVFDYAMPVRVKRTKLYFVPFGTTIGEIKIQQGIGAALYLDILGKEAHVDGSIGLDGLVLKGKLPAFDIGIIKMTDFDETCNPNKAVNPNSLDTEKMPCGPTVDIQANAQNIHFIIDGLMKFGDIFQTRTKWYMSVDGLKFESQTFVGPAASPFGIIVKGSSINFKDKLDLMKLEAKDIFLDIEFQNKLTDFINGKIESYITERKEIFEKDINDSIAFVARLATEDDFKRQQAAVAYAESQRVRFKDDPILSASREADVAKEKVKLDLLIKKLALEKTDLGLFIRKALDNTGFARLIEKALRTTGALGSGALEKGKFVFNKASRFIIIKRITWHGSLEHVASGIVPGFDMELEFGGQVIHRKTPPFNLKDPVASAGVIAQQVSNIVMDGIKASLRGTPIAKTTKDLLEQHIAYWNEHGKTDEEGIKYDDDWNRGQWLLSELEKENPEQARALKGQLLPGSGCRELVKHIRYWEPQGFDGDAAKGQAHMNACRIESPALAEQLSARLANITKGIGNVTTTEDQAQRGGISSGVEEQTPIKSTKGISNTGSEAPARVERGI